MNYINEELIEEELALVEARKPQKFSNKDYPFQQLTEKDFELLLYSSFRKNGQRLLEFEDCHLVAGTGDQGRDIILVQKGKTVGVIQCKRYQSMITKPQAAKEIIKFVLNALQQPRIYSFNNLTYFFAVSKGFNGAASSLLEHFSSQIEQEVNINKWIREVQGEFKKTNLNSSIDLNQILEALKHMKVRKLLPFDIGELMDKDIISSFFAVDKVIDITTFQKMLSKPEIDLRDFMKQYRESQRNNFSRINFFGLAITTKPREVPFEKLFVTPTIQKRGESHSSYFISYNYKENENTKSIGTDIKSFLNRDTIEFSSILNSHPTGVGKTEFYSNFLKEILIDRYTDQTSFFENSYKMPAKRAILHVEEILNSRKNVVVLGKPGAGKSSLVKYLMIQMLSEPHHSKGIPFRVELQKYNMEKQLNSIGLIDYIFNQLRSEHQIHKIRKDDIVEIFSHQKVVIFFDGMDEVLDVQERICVRNDIENIAIQYKNLKCVVTSRFESYDEVNFEEQQFEVFEVNDFDDKQVKEYVQKWYGIEETNSVLRRKEVTACLNELQNIEDELKRNPLLLTLILILYRNELELPTSKLDVYEGCTFTLVDTRDTKEKKLGTDLPISNKIATFSSLAYWQYNKLMDKEEPPITHMSALLHVRNYLLEKGEFEFEHEANDVAKNFLDFAFIRSIYVENNFTHKTFLEYFTAYYLFSNLFSKGKMDQLNEFIDDNIESSSWHVVIELLICKIDKAQGDFSVIDGIVDRQLSANKEESVLFFLSILKYLQNISPRMINRLFELSIAATIQDIQNSNNAIARSMNIQLMELSKNERFSRKLIKKLDEYEESISSKIQDNNYNAFLFENGVVTSRYVRIVTDPKMAMKEDPFLFTLFAIPQMTNVDAYETLLKEYIVAYNDRALVMTHQTRYGSNIFMGSSSFQWLSSFLFSKDYERFVETFRKLVKNGISKLRIIKGINQDNGSILVPYETLLSFLDIETSLARKEIILTALRKYYSYDIGNKKEREPFYKGVVNSKRRFPLPK